jgi:hypothetical protein
VNNQVNALYLDSSNNILYIGGYFNRCNITYTSNSGIPANYIVGYDLNKDDWILFGDASYNGVGGEINAIEYDISNNFIYVGGGFYSVRDNLVNKVDLPSNTIARWDVTNKYWLPLTNKIKGPNVNYGGTGTISSLLFDKFTSDLYISGYFNTPDPGLPVQYHSFYNPYSDSILPFDMYNNSFVRGVIYAYAYDASNSLLYVGGSFNYVYGRVFVNNQVNYYNYYQINCLAIWDVKNMYWVEVAVQGNNGLNNAVLALTFDETNRCLYVGGQFNYVYYATYNTETNSYDRYNQQIQHLVCTYDGCKTWQRVGDPLNSYVYSLVWDGNNRIYIGGSFSTTTPNSVSLPKIGYWDILNSTLNNLNGVSNTVGTNNDVLTIEYDSINNYLYLGGNFNQVYYNGIWTKANYVTIWDLTNKVWKNVGTWAANGTNGTVRTLNYDKTNNSLYIGGDFNQYGLPTITNGNRFCYFSTDIDSPYGVSDIGICTTNSSIYVIEYDYLNNSIYVGGSFTHVYSATQSSGLQVNHIAKWDISNNVWVPLGTNTYGMNSYVRSLKIINNTLYVGGEFTTVDGQYSYNRIATWNLSNSIQPTADWGSLGNSTNNGTNNTVRTIDYDSTNNLLYVGGDFTICYDFVNTGGIQTNYIATFDLTANVWYLLGSPSSYGTNNQVWKIFVVDSSNIYIGGYFQNVRDPSNGQINANFIAKWDGSVWYPLGNPNGNNGVNWLVRDIVLDTTSNNLYICGDFNNYNNGTGWPVSNCIVRYSISSGMFSQLHGSNSNLRNGIWQQGYSMYFNQENNMLYVGGNFDYIVTDDSFYYQPRIAKFNTLTNKWVPFNRNINGLVYTIKKNTINNALIIGGDFGFNPSSARSANQIVKYNPTTYDFTLFGIFSPNNNKNGIFGQIYTIVSDSSYVYVGGNFGQVSDRSVILSNKSASYFVKWNKTTNLWEAIFGSFDSRNGVNAQVYVLKKLDNLVYMGGSFTNANINSGFYARSFVIYNTNTNKYRAQNSKIDNSQINGFGNGYGDLGGASKMLLDRNLNRLYVSGPRTYYDLSNNYIYSNTLMAYLNLSNNIWYPLAKNSDINYDDYNYRFINTFEIKSNKIFLFGNRFSLRMPLGIYPTLSNIQYIVRRDSLNTKWMPLGSNRSANQNGLTDSVFGMAKDEMNNIYMAGKFYSAYSTYGIQQNGVQCYRVVSWNNTDNYWVQMGLNIPYNGVNGTTNGMTYNKNTKNLYIFGSFTYNFNVTSTAANYIVKWKYNMRKFELLGNTVNNGVNSTVNTVGLDISNCHLYIGGNFTDVRRPVSVTRYLSLYDVSNDLILSFNKYGNCYTNGNVYSSFLDASNKKIYFGGNFNFVFDTSNVNGIAGNNIAVWDFSLNVWDVLGTFSFNGTNGPVTTILGDLSNQNIYVAGSFSSSFDSYNSGGTATSYIGVFDVKQKRWNGLGNLKAKGVNGLVTALELDISNQLLYIGGNYSRYGLNPNYINPTNFLKYDFTNNIYVPFSSIYTPYVGWNIKTSVYDEVNNVIYLGGTITVAYDNNNQRGLGVYNVVIWDLTSNTYRNFGGDPVFNGLKTDEGDSTVNFMSYDSVNQYLYVAGKFKYAYDSFNRQGLLVNNIAKWDIANNQWRALGQGVNNTVNSVRYDKVNNNVYIGGLFTMAYSNNQPDGINSKYIAKWDNTKNSWEFLGNSLYNGTDDQVNAMAFDASGQNLFVAGNFKYAYDATPARSFVNFAARWDVTASRWCMIGHQFFVGSSRPGLWIEYDDKKRILYMDNNNNYGMEYSFNTIFTYYDYKYNLIRGPSKHGPTTITGTIHASIYDNRNNCIYVVGSFISAVDPTNYSGLLLNNVAKWDISLSRWFPLGNLSLSGTNGRVRSLLLDYSSNQLFIGGDFNQVNNISLFNNISIVNSASKRIYPLNNAGYVTANYGFRNGVLDTNGQILCSLYDNSNNLLYIGGSFDFVYDTTNVDGLAQSAVACYDCSKNIWIPIPGVYMNNNRPLVLSMKIDISNQMLYIGGFFNGNITSLNLRSKSYVNLGTSLYNGFNNRVSALAIDLSNNYLYAGGDFNVAYDLSNNNGLYCRNFVSWSINKQVWETLGNTELNGTNGGIFSLFLDSSNNNIYVGGQYNEVFDPINYISTANGIAIWNIVNKKWSLLGSNSSNGINGRDRTVNALEYNSTNNTLFVCGQFTNVSDRNNSYSVTCLATWDISNNVWYPTPTTTGSVSLTSDAIIADMCYDPIYNYLYIGGQISSFYRSATGWQNLYNVGICDLSNNTIIQLGDSNRSGVFGTVNNLTLMNNSNIFIGGTYNVNTNNNLTVNAKGIAVYDISANVIKALGNNSSNYVNGSVLALDYDSNKHKLFVGGSFGSVSDISGIKNASYVAMYDTSKNIWELQGGNQANGVNGTVSALKYNKLTEELYIGGAFNYINAFLFQQYITTYKYSKKMFYPLKSGTTNGYVRTTCYDSINNILYVGGDFTYVYDYKGGIIANRIAGWDLSKNVWIVLGNDTYNGTNNTVYAIAIDSQSNNLYVGGQFNSCYDSTNTGGITTYNISSWSIINNTWSTIGNGTSGTVLSIVLDNRTNYLYVGGGFITINSVDSQNINANYIVYWDITQSQWNKLGNGLNGGVRTIALDTSNNYLYMGGWFNIANSINGDYNANYIVYWDLTQLDWFPLGVSSSQGTNSTINSIIVDSSNSAVYVAGHFTSVYDSTGSYNAKYVSIWNTATQTWSFFGDSTFNGTNSVVFSIAKDYVNNLLYVGGQFGQTSDPTNNYLGATYIAIWNFNNNKWEQTANNGNKGSNGLNNHVYWVSVYSDQVYIGGQFNSTNSNQNNNDYNNDTVKNIAVYNLKTGDMYPLGDVFSKNGTNNEVLTLELDISNNLLYAGGYFTYVYDISNSSGLSTGRVGCFDLSNNVWKPIGLYSKQGVYDGNYPAVFSLKLDYNSNRIYIGGRFYTVYDSVNTNGLNTNGLAYFDLSNLKWNRVGKYNGVNNSNNTGVYTFSINTLTNDLYIGGDYYSYNTFQSSNSAFSTYDMNIDMWMDNGNRNFWWGENGRPVVNIHIDPYSSNIYFCGSTYFLYDASGVYYTAGLNNGSTVAILNTDTYKWNRDTVVSQGSITTKTITVDKNNFVYLSGNYSNIEFVDYQQSGRDLIIYNIKNTSFSQFPGSLISYANTFDGQDKVTCLLYDSLNDKLYVGGRTQYFIDSSFNNWTYVNLWRRNGFARWNFKKKLWDSSLGSFTIYNDNAYIRHFVLDNSNNIMYLTNWNNGQNATYALNLSDVSSVGPVQYDVCYNYLQTWPDTTGPTRINNNISGHVFSTSIDVSNQILYHGGSFYVNNLYVNLAKYDISNNKSISFAKKGVPQPVNTVSYNNINGNVYFGGNYSSLSTTPYLTKYDINTNEFRQLGNSSLPDGLYLNSVNYIVNTIHVDNLNLKIYVGGEFTRYFNKVLDAGLISTYAVELNYFDNTFLPFGNVISRGGGNGFNGNIYTIAAYSGNNVFTGGTYTNFNYLFIINKTFNIKATYVAYYDAMNDNWGAFGYYNTLGNIGVDSTVRAVCVDSSNNNVYVGGDFNNNDTYIGGSNYSPRLAVFNFNTETWQSFNVNNSVYSLTLDISNSLLYVGGSFTGVYDYTISQNLSISRIGSINTTTNSWNYLGVSNSNGTNGTVLSLSLDKKTCELFIGGNFNTAYFSSISYV